MTALRAFLRDETAAAAAEFALVLPALLIFLLGTIDVGRWAWSLNEVEKATQIGARHAVVTNLVASGLNTADLSAACGETALNIGDPIDCADAFPAITCDSTGCSCAGGDCGAVDGDAYDDTAFTAILQRMRTIAPHIGSDNLSITYRPSGIGYYGDPTCLGVQSKEGCSTGDLSDVAPIVTVSVSSVQFRPITFAPFGGGVTIPGRSYSLTLEDGFGTAAS